MRSRWSGRRWSGRRAGRVCVWSLPAWGCRTPPCGTGGAGSGSARRCWWRGCVRWWSSWAGWWLPLMPWGSTLAWVPWERWLLGSGGGWAPRRRRAGRWRRWSAAGVAERHHEPALGRAGRAGLDAARAPTPALKEVAVPAIRPSGSDDPAEQVALFRYRVIAEPANPRLGPAERGRLVRALAATAHLAPDGTLDRWIVAWQAGGLDGLRPKQRADAGVVRRHPELLAEAAALRAERPARSAAHIASILYHRHGILVSERTVRAHLRRKGLHRAALQAQPTGVFGRYEAERPIERWIGDVLQGPFVPHPRVAGSKRAKLFVLVDDHSRLLVHGRWVAEENNRAGQDVLRQAIVRRGLPEALYVDNGAPYSNAALDRCCAVLGIRLVHSQPYRPQGRGKQERLNRVIRERFLLEAEAAGTPSLDQLNDRFTAWTEQVLNCRVHTETGQTQSPGSWPA